MIRQLFVQLSAGFEFLLVRGIAALSTSMLPRPNRTRNPADSQDYTKTYPRTVYDACHRIPGHKERVL